jgi:hypothetical protein
MNTSLTLENHGETKELLNHNIQCPDNKILKQYKFIRTNENPNKFYYHYECADNSNQHPNIIDKQTNINDYGNGQSVYLDRHSMECPPTHALSKVHLTGQVDNDPKQIQYNYRCTDANIKNLSEHDTGYNDEGNMSIVFFDRHDIKCPDNSVLNSVKLRRQFPRSGPSDDKFRFEYKCGHTSFASDPHNFYQNSNNVDNKINGHIKSHIQSLILYYGKFKKVPELGDIITSHGGELATNLVERIKDYVKSQGAEYVWRGTQSDSWCPIIWKALQLSGKRIKDEWTRFVPAQHLIDEVALEFSRMPGWIDYAHYILTDYQDPGFDNLFGNHILQNESKKIKLMIMLQNTPNIVDYNKGYISIQSFEVILNFIMDNTINAEFIQYDKVEIVKIVKIIWLGIKLTGYEIPNIEWTMTDSSKSKFAEELSKIPNFAEELSKIPNFAEFVLWIIIFNTNLLEQQQDMRELIDNFSRQQPETNLSMLEQIILLFKKDEHTMYGGKSKYQQKYYKYKQKYLQLKLQK